MRASKIKTIRWLLFLFIYLFSRKFKSWLKSIQPKNLRPGSSGKRDGEGGGFVGGSRFKSQWSQKFTYQKGKKKKKKKASNQKEALPIYIGSIKRAPEATKLKLKLNSFLNS